MKKISDVLEVVVDTIMILAAVINVLVGLGNIEDYLFLLIVGAYGALRIISWSKKKRN